MLKNVLYTHIYEAIMNLFKGLHLLVLCVLTVEFGLNVATSIARNGRNDLSSSPRQDRKTGSQPKAVEVYRILARALACSCLKKMYVRPVPPSAKNDVSKQKAETTTSTTQVWLDDDIPATYENGRTNILLFAIATFPVVAAPVFIFILALSIRRLAEHHYKKTEYNNDTSEQIYISTYTYEIISFPQRV